jgi:acyl carrier protein
MMSDKIREYIEQRFLIEFDESFPEDTDLFKEGVMDSFGYVQMCRFLEKEFNFRFSEQEMTGNVLTSLIRIREYVVQKTAQDVAGLGASVQSG